MVFVLMLMVSVGLATGALLTNFTSTQVRSGQLLSNKRAQYAAEGTLLIVTKIAQSYLGETINPTTAELTARLTAQLPALVAGQYEVTDINVTMEPVPGLTPIATGSFRGMMAPQSILRVSYNVRTREDNNLGPVINLSATVSLAQVSMFQFLYFIDLAYADFSPGPITAFNGRIHANGNLCLSAATGLTIDRVTSAGRLLYGNLAACKYRIVGDQAFIAAGPDLTNPVKLTTNNSNGCTNCGGTRLPWADYATTTWNGKVMDQAHGVISMNLPVPNNVQAQLGADGDDRWVGMSNARNLRFVVDPVNAADSDLVAQQKFAYKSDVRIISGVWYLKDKNNLRNWPGIPIWSDHPGNFVDYFGNNVGQADLAISRSWPSIPHRYSYYEYDATNFTLYNDNRGVISYGNLFRDGSGAKPTWRPGHWLLPNAANPNRHDRICPTGGLLLTPTGLRDAFAPITCNSPGSPGVATALLNGTRGGLHDKHIFTLHPESGQRAARARVLPMNFDVQQFQAALLDTTPGELGSYFGAGRLMNERFNGVVYISSRWNAPGVADGFDPADQPLPHPQQGSPLNNDINQLAVATGPGQRALPQNLCTTGALVGRPFDLFANGLASAWRFVIPNCTSYGGSGISAYPHAIRIFNGHALDPAQMTSGLSVVTNIGAYVMGEYNTQSNTASETATPWIPALIGADQINFLSNAWSDENSSWEDTTHTAIRIASPTVYNMSVLTGWSRSRNSQTMSAFPTMMEDWRTARITFNGSMVMGFYPTYERYGKSYSTSGYIYRAGERLVTYDRHYQFMLNQPPGAPLFYISALLDWKAE